MRSCKLKTQPKIPWSEACHSYTHACVFPKARQYPLTIPHLDPTIWYVGRSHTLRVLIVACFTSQGNAADRVRVYASPRLIGYDVDTCSGWGSDDVVGDGCYSPTITVPPRLCPVRLSLYFCFVLLTFLLVFASILLWFSLPFWNCDLRFSRLFLSLAILPSHWPFFALLLPFFTVMWNMFSFSQWFPSFLQKECFIFRKCKISWKRSSTLYQIKSSILHFVLVVSKILLRHCGQNTFLLCCLLLFVFLLGNSPQHCKPQNPHVRAFQIYSFDPM